MTDEELELRVVRYLLDQRFDPMKAYHRSRGGMLIVRLLGVVTYIGVPETKAYAFADLIELCVDHMKTHWLESVRAASP